MTTKDWTTILVSIIIVLGGGFISLVIGWLFWLSKTLHEMGKKVAAQGEVCAYMKHNIPDLWAKYDALSKGESPESPSVEERKPPGGGE
jgi:hypothetical protein